MSTETRLIVSIDTEEDNWFPCRDDISVSNASRLLETQQFLSDLGLRATYFVDHPVVSDEKAAGVLRELSQSDHVEIGAHLHPWNTPPADEALVPRNTMLGNLPEALQQKKLEHLGAAIERGVGLRPTSFRAGRFGTSAATLRLMARCGYTTDSSVMPWTSWAGDHGPDFRRAPMNIYRPDLDSDFLQAGDSGPLVEVPLSAGFTRSGFARRDRLREQLSSGWLARVPARALASRLGLARHVILSPETDTAEDMVALARSLVREGARHLQIFWHSPSMVPGLTPFVATQGDLDRLRGRIRDLVHELRRMSTVRPASVGEAAAEWRAANPESAGLAPETA